MLECFWKERSSGAQKLNWSKQRVLTSFEGFLQSIYLGADASVVWLAFTTLARSVFKG